MDERRHRPAGRLGVPVGHPYRDGLALTQDRSRRAVGVHE